MDEFAPSPEVVRIREQLGHPVIDSDGHLVEFRPVAMEYIERAGGSDIAQRFTDEQRATFLSRDWYGLTDDERMARWTHRPPFWGEPLRNHGLDLATATFPDLLYRRLDQLGIDFTVLFPTIGINPQGYADEEVRRACCRGLNDYYADHWMGHPDRMTPVAVVPMATPEEAIDELEHAVRDRRVQGGDAPELREAAPELGCVARRHVRHRQRARLRPGVGEVPRARCRPRLPRTGRGLDLPRLDLESRLQPRGALRDGRQRGVQVVVPRRRQPAVPGAAVPLPRRRRRLGPLTARRSHRSLGEAQPRRPGARQRPAARRRRPLRRPVRAVRRLAVARDERRRHGAAMAGAPRGPDRQLRPTAGRVDATS